MDDESAGRINEIFGGKPDQFFARNGDPILASQWSELLSDFAYKVVAQDRVAGRWFVSTVWLGMNHNWGDGPPLIFETMVFDQAGYEGPAPPPVVGDKKRDWLDQYMQRYATEEEAIRGHQQVLAMVRATAELSPGKVPEE